MERLPSLVLLIQHILLLFRSSLKFFGWSPSLEDDFPQACGKGKSNFSQPFFSVLSVCDVWNVPTLTTCLPAYPGPKKMMCQHTNYIYPVMWTNTDTTYNTYPVMWHNSKYRFSEFPTLKLHFKWFSEITYRKI